MLITASLAKFQPNLLKLEILSQSQIPGLSNELQLANLQKFIIAKGLTLQSYRKLRPRFDVPPEFEKYRFLELQDKPLVILDDSHILIPSAHLFVWALSTGLFYALSDHTKGEGKRNQFRTLFGLVFQDYVGRILNEAPLLLGKQWEVVPEFRSKLGKDSPDWLLVRDNTVILIECKTSRLTLESRTFAYGEKFDDDARRCFVRPLQKLRDFVIGVRNRTFDHSSLRACKHFYGVVISFEPLRFANSTYSRIFSDDIADVHEVLDGFQFMAIEELERLVSFQKPDILTILTQKLNEAREDEWGGFLGKNYPVPEQHPVLRQKLYDLFPGFEEHQRGADTKNTDTD